MNAVIQRHRDTLVVTLPLRTVSESNARGHWGGRATRTKGHRTTCALALGPQVSTHSLPVRVLMTRIAPRALDDDNLRGALKACRDGVADALGVDDRDPRVMWSYDQKRGRPGEYAVEITVFPDTDASGTLPA